MSAPKHYLRVVATGAVFCDTDPTRWPGCVEISYEEWDTATANMIPWLQAKLNGCRA